VHILFPRIGQLAHILFARYEFLFTPPQVVRSAKYRKQQQGSTSHYTTMKSTAKWRTICTDIIREYTVSAVQCVCPVMSAASSVSVCLCLLRLLVYCVFHVVHASIQSRMQNLVEVSPCSFAYWLVKIETNRQTKYCNPRCVCASKTRI
jgi:hypothetical protein